MQHRRLGAQRLVVLEEQRGTLGRALDFLEFEQ
jgi:hypothetical protein